MPPNPNYQKILDFMQITMPLMSREYGHIFTKGNLITNDISYPKYPVEEAQIKKNIKTLLKGSVLTNIFAIWERNTPNDILEWMTSSEVRKLQAFRHVRDSIAHNYFGGRADYASRRTAFEAEYPFSNIDFDSVNKIPKQENPMIQVHRQDQQVDIKMRYTASLKDLHHLNRLVLK